MIQQLYSLYDVQARDYGAPFVAVNEVVAARAVKAGLPADHIARKYPDHFEVVHVGSWNTDVGTIDPVVGSQFRATVRSILGEENG